MIEHLLPSEKMISESKNGLITLTTHRIRYYSKSMQSAHLIGIMLHNISSVRLAYRSKPLFLILALTGFATGAWLLYSENDESFIIPMAVGLFLLVVYLLSRKAAFIIASNGGASIHFHTTGMKRADQLKFINQVEEAIETHRLMLPTA